MGDVVAYQQEFTPMGAFNRLLVEHECVRCGSTVERAFQFKYGHKWQDDYRIGDRLDWGGNDEGTPGLAWVQFAGIPEECVACGADDDAFYVITMRSDILTDVARVDGVSWRA